MASDDMPTPEQVAAYLEARGWASRPDGEWLVWVRAGDRVRLLPGHRGNMRLLLSDLSTIEGRPSPAEQVRRDLVQVDAPKLDDDPCGCCGHARAVHDNSGSCRATDDREGDRCCFCPSFARPWGGTR